MVFLVPPDPLSYNETTHEDILIDRVLLGSCPATSETRTNFFFLYFFVVLVYFFFFFILVFLVALYVVCLYIFGS